MSGSLLAGRRRIATVFLAFAFAYFFSTLVRAITATLSPALTAEFGLESRDLGLLAGGYFLGFAFTQLPMGTWLDRHGPKRVIVSFLSAAVAGCLLFSVATHFWLLLAARVLTGVGVSACLMAPLTGYRRWLTPPMQLRSNSWMLMVGSFGLVGATLPVQWLMPYLGWRPLFWLLAAGVLVSMALIAWAAPAWHGTAAQEKSQDEGSYAAVWRDPFFRKLAPIGFFNYGGFVAMQTLWVVPWLTRVAGHTPQEAAGALFWISIALLATYWLWGVVNPRLAHRGISAARLLGWGMPLGMLVLALVLIAGPAAGTVAWVIFLCVSTVVTLAQPAVALALPTALAGRALSAYNLVVFAGVFVVQWGIGLLIDLFASAGLDPVASFRAALSVFLACCVMSYVYFLWAPPHNRSVVPRPA
ncbi:putative transporter, MFS-type [Variovorax paradoxus B4]|uniref:Inner membrane transport protein YajR n=2 Tax=Variovorax paradoxus TaxID=34073 RepID=A0A0H2LXD9_VARPD|nr:MFS transporter [Variovorax paradoxus]AGU52135.1 putative transporter, MFS-type [Variovorax paradoxus B4]KLN54884.1 inner membrane transport protein YajR [Variovorax paradoxus]